MKRILWLFLIAALIGSNCSNDNAEPTPPHQIPSDSIDIDSDEDSTQLGDAVSHTFKLQINSTSDWHLNLSDSRTSVDWITPATYSGKAGTQTVTFDIEENTRQNSRTAYIRLTNETNQVVLTYTQQKYSLANLYISVSEISVNSKAQNMTCTLKSDLAWRIESGDESFCTVSPIQGEAGEYTIKVAFTENTSTENKRSTTIKAYSGYETATVRVEQDRTCPVLNIDRGIRSLDDLCRFRDAVNSGESLAEWKYNGEINLLADIDLSYIESWIPIGSYEKPFSDIFNGNGFTVDHLTIRSSYYSLGFFGRCSGGTIKNLNIRHAYVEQTNNGGGRAILCGNFGSSNKNAGRISNCTVEGLAHGGAIVGNCYGDNQAAYITDCVNRAIATHFFYQGGNDIPCQITSCRNEGVVTAFYYYPDVFPSWAEDCTNNGYVINQLYWQELVDQGIDSLDKFIDYFSNCGESLVVNLRSCNENFLDLAASNSGNVKNLHITDAAYDTSNINQFTKFIDKFSNLKLLEYKLENTNKLTYNGQDPLHIFFDEIKDALETLIIHSGQYIKFPSSAHKYFPNLKKLIFDDNNNSELDLLLLDKLEYLDCSDCCWLERLLIESNKLEYLDCSGCERLYSLNVSRTNLGNSSYTYPLICKSCGSAKWNSTYRRFILTLKEDWEINGINVNSNADYIPSYAEIQYEN